MGGFAQAANALHRSQSAVSYAVGRLQEALGLPLLELDGRKSVLTPHGKTLLSRARSLLRDLDTLEAVARSSSKDGNPKLKLVVDAAFPRTQLFAIVADLQRACPTTDIQLADACCRVPREANHGAARGCRGDQPASPPGFLGDRLIDVEFIAVARSGHPLLLIDRPLTLDDLDAARTGGRARFRIHPAPGRGWLGADHRYTVSSMESSVAWCWQDWHTRGCRNMCSRIIFATASCAAFLSRAAVPER